jgi:fructosamine-3-kinase
MLETGDAAEVAEWFSLGGSAVLMGPVARGEVGRVWKLSTSLGAFAVKEPFEPIALQEVREHADFQQTAGAAGVPTPAVIRTGDGDAHAELGDTQVRVFEWVELRARNPDVDPAEVGSIVAAIHRLRYSGQLPTDPWYTEPIGASRWDELVSALHAKGAPFARGLAAMRDELVALEGLLEAPRDLQTCHRDLWADNVLRTSTGPLCVIDWENCGLADPEPGAGARAVRVRPRYGPPSAGPLRGVSRRRRSRADRSARQLLDAHRAARSHRRERLPAMARSERVEP